MKKINRLVSIGIMKMKSLLQWAYPTFIIPKKDMTMQNVSEFRELKRIVKRPYPIPNPTPHCRSQNFTYATA
jgi:hypothetical protein